MAAIEEDDGGELAAIDAWICVIGIVHKNRGLMMLPPDLTMPIDAVRVAVGERDGLPLPLSEKKEVLEMGCGLDRSGLHTSSPADCMGWICRRGVANDGFTVKEGDALLLLSEQRG
ncbi:hypothetical protein ACLOJK_024273 [Asimina triloba]